MQENIIKLIKPAVSISGNPTSILHSNRWLAFFKDSIMRYIPLTQGKFAIVDDEDYEELSKHKWCAMKTSYGGYRAARTRQRVILMHRQIMSAPKGMDVDHINHDTLDNRKSNLRVCTRSQNMSNSSSHKDSRSKYKGVSWYKPYKKWQTWIMENHRKINLGCFKNETEAAKAYDRAAIKYFGEYAKLNFERSNYAEPETVVQK